MELRSVFGLPAHPLLVHMPIVLIPLSALVAAVMVAWRPWRRVLAWVVAGMSFVSLVSVQLAMGSGEQLAENERSALVTQHIHLADQARPIAAAFFVLAFATLVAVELPLRASGTRFAARGATAAKLVAPLVVLTFAGGAAATVWIARAGHAGAKAVWQGRGTSEREGQSERPGDGG